MPVNCSAGDYLSLDELGEFVRQQRKVEGETQEEVAASLGIEQPNVSRAESGQSNAKDTLFRLVERYSGLRVEKEPYYHVIER